MNIIMGYNGVVVGASPLQENGRNCMVANVTVQAAQTGANGQPLLNKIELHCFRKADMEFLGQLTQPTAVSFLADHFVIKNIGGEAIVEANAKAILPGLPNGKPELFVSVTNAGTGKFPAQDTTNQQTGVTRTGMEVSTFGKHDQNGGNIYNAIKLTTANKQIASLMKALPQNSMVSFCGPVLFNLTRQGNAKAFVQPNELEVQTGRNQIKLDAPAAQPQNGGFGQVGAFSQQPQANGFAQPQQNGFGQQAQPAATPAAPAPAPAAPAPAPAPAAPAPAPAAQPQAASGFGGNGFGTPAPAAPPVQQANNVGGILDDELPF